MNAKADIVERLRERNFSLFDGIERRQADPLSGEAADEIERLRALPPLRAREEIAPDYEIYLGNYRRAAAQARDILARAEAAETVSTDALSLPAGQEWRDMLAALRDARMALYNPFERDNQSLTYKRIDAAIIKAESAAPPVAEPIVAERKGPIGFVNIYRHADCHKLGGTDIYKTIDQAKTFDASDYDKGYLGIGVVTLLAEQRPETK